jgi:hypothetical protein
MDGRGLIPRHTIHTEIIRIEQVNKYKTTNVGFEKHFG